jgi:hypothetical protein
MPPAPAFNAFATKGAVMRAHQVIAVVAVIVMVGVGVNPAFLAAPTAEADSLAIRRAGVDVSQLYQNVENLPVQECHDRSVVYSGRD